MINKRNKDSRLKTLVMAVTKNPQMMVNQLQLATKLLTRRVSRLPLVARCLLVFSMALSFVMYSSLFYIVFTNRLRSETFWNTASCPACFGVSLCEAAKEGRLHTVGWSRIALLDYVNIDGTHTAVMDDATVLLRRHASARDMQRVDDTICDMAKEPSGCNVAAAAGKVYNPRSGTDWMEAHLTGMSNATYCPTDRLIMHLMDKYHEKNDAIMLSARERTFLVTTLMLNQEPIIVQCFPKSEGWPFVTYYGACGRYTVTRGTIVPLSHYADAPWELRARLALQVLRIAEKFSENKLQFAFYWTDLKYDDFGVEPGDIVVVNNAKNLMIVDTWQIKTDKLHTNWDKTLAVKQCDNLHTSNIGACLSANADHLCKRHASDHNYLAVCEVVLSRFAMSPTGHSVGLLREVPEDTDALYNIRRLADTCARPSEPSGRLHNARQLITALMEISGPKLTHL